MSVGAPSRRILWLAAGFSVWGSGLVLLYGLHALGCAFLWQPGTIRLALWLTLALHLLALALLALGFRRAGGGEPGETAFLGTIAFWTLLSALAATLLSLAPPLMLTVCL